VIIVRLLWRLSRIVFFNYRSNLFKKRASCLKPTLDEGDDDSMTVNSQACMNPSSVIIDANRFANINTDISITELTLSGDCLTVRVSSSGCDGATWTLDLIDSNVISSTDPPQRRIALEFNNTELCGAVFQRDFYFDVSNTQTLGNQVELNFVNSDTSFNSILYNY